MPADPSATSAPSAQQNASQGTEASLPGRVTAGTLTRYRVMAYVVGVLLLVLVLVAMPLKYLAGNPTPVAVVGPIHGFLYAVYLVFAFDLGIKAKWSIKGMVMVLLAGTIPFLSFVAERWVTRRTRRARTI